MADSDEESSNSENNWPMNEDWMIQILRGDNKNDDKVKINVILYLMFVCFNFGSELMILIRTLYTVSISVPNQYANMESVT